MYVTLRSPTLEIQNPCIFTDKFRNCHVCLPHLLPSPGSTQLQALLHANVSQVQVDECVRAACQTAGGCSTRLSVADTPTLVDSGALSLASVKVTSSAVCGCAAREMNRQPCSSYRINPCLNGGTCVDTQGGYR